MRPGKSTMEVSQADLAAQMVGMDSFFGCRALDLEAKQAIVRELEGWIVYCVYDQNGNHVIQKCLEFVKPSSHIRFLLEVSAWASACTGYLQSAYALGLAKTLQGGTACHLALPSNSSDYISRIKAAVAVDASCLLQPYN